jgi:hypothetical protein
MPKRRHKIYVAVCVTILGTALPALLSGQSSDPCKNVAAQAEWSKGNNPVYADAMELAHALTDRGILVECVLNSKEDHRFDGQKGAAWYKTDGGVFEVWFLPKTETFAAFEVTERPQANGRYLYTFSGTPGPRGSESSSKQEYFIKYGNALFKVWGDKRLATSLEQALQKL